MWKFENDNTGAVLSAKEQVSSEHYGKSPVKYPKTAILFYMNSGVEYLLEKYNCRLVTDNCPRFLQSCPVYEFDGICFLDGGRGAPFAVDTIETLNALGVKRIFSVGMFGAFSEKVKAGDIVVPDKVFVEEGTTLHYYSELEYAEPNRALFDVLSKEDGVYTYPLVSTDGVYRQTYFKEQLWRDKGAVGVDMETSALMSVGKYLGMEVASMLMASDLHPMYEGAPKWQWTMTKEMRYTLFDKAVSAIKKCGEI